jgi:tetratricopeptide (TPR) repeat protein
LHATIESILAEKPEAAEDIADDWFDLALCERDAVAANRALAATKNNLLGASGFQFFAGFGEGLVRRMTGDTAGAEAAFRKARETQEKVVAEQPGYGPAVCFLGLIDAGLGRKEDALREGRRAVELAPGDKDANIAAHMVVGLAIIAAWTGEKDLAIEQLERSNQLPLSNQYFSYGFLKLHPFWDPLRGDPRFEKIVASLAPKGKR